jgi:Na+-translocating ferredoxin:NAD+ oxidoreductase subunit D
MPQSTNFHVSSSPHIHSGDTVLSKMGTVILALLPAYFVGLYYFGLGALIVTGVSVFSCMIFEWLIQKLLLKQKSTITDGSALLTGLLLGMNLPSNIPVWMVVAGSLVAIGVAKMSFGGLGKNIFNPALVGRVFMLISFPAQMTIWPAPHPLNMHYLDAETAATALSMSKEFSVHSVNNWDLFIGNAGGSIGEVSVLALLLGFALLLIRKVIRWHIPVSILSTVFVISAILHFVNPHLFPTTALFHLLSGGLMLGAIFMATDYTTSPMTGNGMLIYGVGIGVITVLIRNYGIYPEGISFAILMMNGATPLINKYVKPKRYWEGSKR